MSRKPGTPAAALEDAWGDPAPPADLRSPSLKGGPALTDIYRALLTGLDGSPMPSFRETTTEEQRWDLVAFIAEVRRQAEKLAKKRKAEEMGP